MVTFAPKKNVKGNMGNFLLDPLLAIKDTMANNVFDLIPQRMLCCKIFRDLQSDSMTWRFSGI
jgi:hypothetical protein